MVVKKLIIIPDFMLLLKIIFKHNMITVSDMHNETEITYAHLHAIKNLMIKEGWIEEIVRGVNKYIKLTQKGTKVTAAVNILFQTLNIEYENMFEYRRVTNTKNSRSKKMVSLSKAPVEDNKKEDVVIAL